jgi:hypothetical protein
LGQGAAWGDYDRDGHVDLFVANTGDQNEFLYRNDGQGGMIPMVDGPVVRSAGRSQSGAWADYDGDGDLDLFVANSWDQRNYLFRNDGGTFASVTGSPWDNDRGNSIGAAWADYDNDGDLDLYIGNGNRVAFLYQNNGDGTFTRILEGPVATSSSVHIAPAWGDLDNDGYLDLFVGVGEGENDLLFHNQRDGTFTQIIEGEVVNDFLVGSGAAWTDFDNDGFLDLFVANDGMYDSGPPHRNEPDRLYHNQARANGNNNRWLLVQLIGTQSNRSAIGAKVRARSLLWSRDVWQLREISGGGGHCSQNDLRAHFGLGDATTVTTLRIEWPSGTVQELTNVAANQILTITEPARLVPLGPREFQIRCWKGMQFEVEKSHNLQTWDSLGVVTNETGTLIFQYTQGDPQAACCFYRVASR